MQNCIQSSVPIKGADQRRASTPVMTLGKQTRESKQKCILKTTPYHSLPSLLFSCIMMHIQTGEISYIYTILCIPPPHGVDVVGGREAPGARAATGDGRWGPTRF